MASTTRRTSVAADRRAAAEARTLDVVEELLRSGANFTELSVERIASEAGLSRSTFYLYFHDKTELILRLVASLKAGTFETGADWAPGGTTDEPADGPADEPADEPADGPADGLEWLADAYLRVIRNYRGRSATLAAVLEVAGYDRVVRETLEAGQQRFIERIAARLAEEQRAGRTSGLLDPLTAARAMVWGGEQAIARHVIDISDDDADTAMARELAASHWYGVYRRP